MENENPTLKTIEEVKELLNLLPTLSYWDNLQHYINIPEYGTGKDAFDLLKSKFETLDLSKPFEYSDLDKQISKQKREIKVLEKRSTNLNAIIGESRSGEEGTIAHNILKNLNSEIEKLLEKRDKLIEEEKTLQTNLELKLADLDSKKQDAIKQSNKKIQEAELNATSKVKLINQFKDFIEETNDNMKLYKNVIIGVLIAAILAISISVPNLLKVFESYNNFVIKGGTNISNWQFINFAFGILIVKLPWAICISAVLTGMYSLLKGLLITYEKINQDKRNMSAIYAISGNVAQALNEYGITLAEDFEDEETGANRIVLNVEPKELAKKRENFRWNQIMQYFEKMESLKEETINNTDDISKYK
jgi:hypothetical protein